MSDDGAMRAFERANRRIGMTEAKEVPFGAGTSFPSSPPTGLVWFRTDLGYLCYYDGSQWLTMHEYTLPIVYNQAFAVATNTALIPVPAALSGATNGFYAVRATVITNVAAPNGAGNNWAVTVQGINTPAGAGTGIYSFNTSADTAATNTVHEGITVNVPANKTWVRVNAAINAGAPGAITLAASLSYRLIIL